MHKSVADILAAKKSKEISTAIGIVGGSLRSLIQILRDQFELLQCSFQFFNY